MGISIMLGLTGVLMLAPCAAGARARSGWDARDPRALAPAPRRRSAPSQRLARALLPGLRCLAVGAGDRRGDRREKLQAALADVGGLVDRPTGAPHALYRGVWRLGRFGRREERCRRLGLALVLIGTRAPAIAQGVVKASRSHGPTLKDSAHEQRFRFASGISWLSWSNGRTRRPAGRGHGGMSGLRYCS